MEEDKSPTRGPALADPSSGLAELPTQSAELKITSAVLEVSVGPGQSWGTAKGTVPPDQAHHLITTFGILGSAITGTGGAVLTLHVAPNLTTLALAELVIALVSAMLIAACGHVPARRNDKRGKDSRDRKPTRGERSS